MGWEGQKSALISSLFDVGGIAGECTLSKLIVINYSICILKGGILTGLLSDILHARAFSCSITLLLAIPSVSVHYITCEINAQKQKVLKGGLNLSHT